MTGLGPGSRDAHYWAPPAQIRTGPPVRIFRDPVVTSGVRLSMARTPVTPETTSSALARKFPLLDTPSGYGTRMLTPRGGRGGWCRLCNRCEN
jgi:hypothetical protein